MFTLNVRLIALFIVSALLSHFAFLFHFNRTLPADWQLFNSLSLLLRTIVLRFGEIPLHNPWSCGGLDLMANPQTWFLAPRFVLDLILRPHWANLASLIVYAVLAQWGMYRVLRDRFSLSVETSVLGGVLWINTSFFGLHLTEGHIIYGCMHLLPWVFWATQRFERPASQLLLAFLLALMALDGSMYAFVLSGVMVLSGFILHPNLRVERPILALACVAVFGLLASAKFLPLFYTYSGREPVLETFAMPWWMLKLSLFYPFQSIYWELNNPVTPYRFHEFGAYIGLGSVLVVFSARKTPLRILGVALFFLWVATGFGGFFNPWSLFQRIPVLNNAHVQSRYLILFFFFFLLAWMIALDRFSSRRSIFFALLGFFALESFLVKNYPVWDAFKRDALVPHATTIIGSDNLEVTNKEAHRYDHFLNRNAGSRVCDDPAQVNTRVKAIGDVGYRGEIYFEQGRGDATLLQYVPAHITVDYQRAQPDSLITINTNELNGWRVASGPATLVARDDRLVHFSPTAEQGRVELTYMPFYRNWVPALAVFGYLFLLGCALWVRRLK